MKKLLSMAVAAVMVSAVALTNVYATYAFATGPTTKATLS